METLFAETVADFGETRGLVGLEGEAAERHAKRLAQARKAAVSERLGTASEFLFAAAVLSTSKATIDLQLAEKLAMRAGELGDERGSPLAGEVIDKRLWQAGEPQRYGTQIVFDRKSGHWRLWDVDPRTSDVQRRMMGLPTLKDLTSRAEAVDERLGEWMKNRSGVEVPGVPQAREAAETSRKEAP
jgi:hypothetical protein